MNWRQQALLCDKVTGTEPSSPLIGARLRSTLKQRVSPEQISQPTSPKCGWDATQEETCWYVWPGTLCPALQRHIFFNYLDMTHCTAGNTP